MSVEYCIICDRCSGVIDGNRVSATKARQSVREIGGRVNLPGGMDLCPQCVRAGLGVDSTIRTSPRSRQP